MRSKLLALVLLCAAPAARGEELGPLFDGARGPRLELPAAPGGPLAEADGQGRRPTPVPPDLAAARSRVGVEAQLARLGGASARESFVFGVIGDAEPGRFPWERVFSPGPEVFADELAALDASGADFILQLGDFVSKGTAENYRAHVDFLDARSGPPLLRCLGNHDRSRPNGDADKNLYDAVFGPRDYFFDRGGWRFIALDSSNRELTAAQLAWLAQALDSPRRKVIFTHVPPAFLRGVKPLAAVGALEEEEPAPEAAAVAKSGGYVHDVVTNYFQDGSARFEELVSRGDVAAVYMGHIHAFWAGDHRGVRYVISGGGGSPLYPLPPGYPKKRFAHYLTVTASPSGLVETVHPYHGGSFVLPPVAPQKP